MTVNKTDFSRMLQAIVANELETRKRNLAIARQEAANGADHYLPDYEEDVANGEGLCAYVGKLLSLERTASHD